MARLTQEYWTRLKMTNREKHSILSVWGLSDEEKKFYNFV